MAATGLYFRLDDALVAQFKKNANQLGLTYADYMTLMILHPPTLLDVDMDAIDETTLRNSAPLVTKNEMKLIWRELNAQGRNLNQAVHALNIIAAKGESLDKAELRAIAHDMQSHIDGVDRALESVGESFGEIARRAYAL